MHSRSFVEKVTPLFIVYKSLGFANYKFDDKNETIKAQPLGIILTVAFWILATFVFFKYPIDYNLELGSNLIENTYQLQLRMQVVLFSALFVFHHYKRLHVLNFLKSILKFDKTIDEYEWAHRPKDFVVVYEILMATYLVLSVIYVLGYYFYIQDYDLLYSFQAFVFVLDYILLFIVPMQFVFSCHCVLIRFETLHRNVA